METIKNYLEAMFASMPNTPEVRKAKDELLQMMEDKYNEMIAEGVNENTAVGTVISEFGNLEELAEDLGLTKEVEEVQEREKEQPRRFVSMDEIKDFLNVQKRRAFMIALGVFLCITSVVWPILIDALAGNNGEYYGAAVFHTKAEAMEGALFFISIAIAVGLFVYSGIMCGDWKYLEKEACKIDMQTADMVKGMRSAFKSFRVVAVTIGCVLCVTSVVPCILFDESEVVPVFLFIFVGVGVFLFVYTGIINGGFEKVLKLNDRKTLSGNYGKDEDDVEYVSKTAEVIMEVYWSTVTCIYLIISFLTFNWHTTWIIWPIAAVLRKILMTALVKEEE